MSTRYCLAVALLLLCGCTSTRVRPGSLHTPSADLTQSYDPKDASDLNTETEKTEKILIPAGSLVTFGSNTIRTATLTTMETTTRQKTTGTIGAAQKNTYQEIAAKLKSLTWLVALGAAVFLFGIASAVYPPLKVIVGSSVTTSVVIALGGLALIALPYLLIGHELLILCCAIGIPTAYLFIHRHGSLKGELDAIKKHVLPQNTS